MKNGSSNRNTKSVLIGLAVGILLSMLLSAVTAFLFSKEWVGEGTMWTIGWCIHMLSSFAVGMVTGSRSQEKKAIYAGITSGAYLLFWIGFSILMFEGIQSGFMSTFLATVVGAVLSWALFMIPKGNKRRAYLKRFS